MVVADQQEWFITIGKLLSISNVILRKFKIHYNSQQQVVTHMNDFNIHFSCFWFISSFSLWVKNGSYNDMQTTDCLSLCILLRLRFQTAVKASSVHMMFHFDCISKRSDILIDMRRHLISGSVYMIFYHPRWNFISAKMTAMK